MTLKRKPVADHEKDWTITKERPANPETFDSMFTSSHGELWWARITEDKRQLVVWGSDIGQESATSFAGFIVEPGPEAVREDLHQGVGDDIVYESPDTALHLQL